MRRHAIGAIAFVLLAGAAVLWAWSPAESTWLGLEAAFWRVGALMAVLWLAYPDVRRMPAWLVGVVPIAIILVAVRPRWFLYLLPALLVLAVLQWWKRPVQTSGKPQRHGDTETQ